MKTKAIFLVVFLPLFLCNGYGQKIFLSKKFTDEQEWRLSFKVMDAYETNSFNFCSQCMDKLFEFADNIDQEVLETGLMCYDKTFQHHKIKTLYQSGVYDKIDYSEIELSTTLMEKGIFELEKFDEQPEEKVENPALADTLIHMLIADQYYRSLGITNKMAELGYEVHNDFLESHTRKELDSINNIIFDRILANRAFPTQKEVGFWGMQALFLNIQHRDLEVFEQYLDDINNSFDRGEINAHNYANMIDRREIFLGNKQIYGTQPTINEKEEWVLLPIKDEDQLNQRRMKIGLAPIEKFLLKYNWKRK